MIIPKLWDLLTHNLTRLSVGLDTALDTVRDAMHQAELIWQEIEDSNKPPEPISLNEVMPYHKE